MGNLLFDLRFALRNLARRPGFAAVSILTLALGIGAVTSIFAVARGVVLRPLPYPDPEELVVVWETQVERELPKMFAAPPNFQDWVRDAGSLDGLAAFDTGTFLLAGEDAEAETLEVRGARVSAGLFATLGVDPLLGRPFEASEDRPGGEAVAIVGHDLWRRRFGADPELPGRVVSLDGAPHRVVGIMPPGFDFPPAITLEGSAPAEKAELWTPLALGPASGSRGAHYLTVIGRLADGVSREAAEGDLSRVAAAIAAEHPDTNAGWSVAVTPLREEVLGEVGPALALLLGAVGFVLLIACVNLSSLLLGQAEERRREIEVRRSLGASAGRVARQLVTEAVATTTLGGLAGLGLAVLLLDLLVALAPRNVPRLDEVAIDPVVVGVAFALAIATGLLVSLVPALRAVGRERHGSAGSAGSGRAASTGRPTGYGGALVVAEVALALVLLAGAGLFARSFLALAGSDAGFQAERVVTARLTLPPGTGDDAADRAFRARTFERAEGAIAGVPGVRAAGFVLELPLDADRQGTRALVGQAGPAGGDADFDGRPTIATNFTFATPGYLPAMGVPLLAGRLPEAGDRVGSERVLVINRAFARQMAGQLGLGARPGPGAGDLDPSAVLGRSVFLESQGQPQTIVGVVGDVLHDSLDREPFPNAYVPYAQLPYARSLALAVRTDLSPDEAYRGLRARLAEVEPRAILHGVRSMEGIVSASVAQPRFNSLLLAAFAVAALGLAAVGVYGVLAASVRRRTREIGVRVAIGATRGRLIGAVAATWLSRVALGIAVGLAAALALGRSVESLLYGVQATDPATLLAAAALLAAVAAVACWIPTRRALAIDPKEALRAE